MRNTVPSLEREIGSSENTRFSSSSALSVIRIPCERRVEQDYGGRTSRRQLSPKAQQCPFSRRFGARYSVRWEPPRGGNPSEEVQSIRFVRVYGARSAAGREDE